MKRKQFSNLSLSFYRYNTGKKTKRIEREVCILIISVRKESSMMFMTRTETKVAAQRYLLIGSAAFAVSAFYAYVSYSASFDDMMGVFMAPLLLGFLPLKILAETNRMYLPDRRTLALHSAAVSLFMLGSVFLATTGGMETGRHLTAFFGCSGSLCLFLTALSYVLNRAALLRKLK